MTFVIVDEEGLPVVSAKVSVTFEVLGGNNRATVVGLTDKTGKYVVSHRSTHSSGFGVEKDGYYESKGGQHFENSVNGKWQPWDPNIKVVLRKIISPVPMYTRNTKEAKMDMPVVNKAVGFDLIDFDWVAPYGHGKYSDLIFKLDRKYVTENNFDCKLQLTFPNKYDGIQEVTNKYSYSVFKLPRLAPEDGYKNIISQWRTYDNNSFIDSRYYIFRIRSVAENGKLIRAMYGKIHGDIRFDPRGSNTASIIFKYYLNPDYTNNLEYDPKQNLFKNIQSYEGLTNP